MQLITALTLLCATLVLALLTLAVCTRRAADSARAAGYDQGYDDAKLAANTRATALHHDITRLQELAIATRGEHNKALEAIIQDCDERIATFARRANPFTYADFLTLHTCADQLDLLSRTFHGFGSTKNATQATHSAQQTLNMAERLRATLAAEPTEQEVAA